MTDQNHSSIKAAEKHIRNAAQNILDTLTTIKAITKEDQPVKTIATPATPITLETPRRRSRHGKKHGNTPHERDQYKFEKRKKREAYRRERNLKVDY